MILLLSQLFLFCETESLLLALSCFARAPKPASYQGKIIPVLHIETSSKLMTASSIEWFQLVSVRKPNRKPFSTCPRAYAKQLTQCLRRKIKSSQHHSLKTGSRLTTVMTASFKWFQLVSVRKANRKPFSTCPSAYAKQLAQCSCGSAVSSNSHEKFHWPIQYLWPQ